MNITGSVVYLLLFMIYGDTEKADAGQKCKEQTIYQFHQVIQDNCKPSKCVISVWGDSEFCGHTLGGC